MPVVNPAVGHRIVGSKPLTRKYTLTQRVPGRMNDRPGLGGWIGIRGELKCWGEGYW